MKNLCVCVHPASASDKYLAYFKAIMCHRSGMDCLRIPQISKYFASFCEFTSRRHLLVGRARVVAAFRILIIIRQRSH